MMGFRRAVQWSMICLLVLAYPGPGRGQITTCSSCATCESALKSGSYSEVYLGEDISTTATCINLNAGESGLVFDCAGHTISGDGSGFDYGIEFQFSSGNTVRDCTFSHFYTGILVWTGSNHVVRDNLLYSNTNGIDIANGSTSNTVRSNWTRENLTGVKISTSDGNVLTSNDSCGNTNYDIEVTGTGNSGTDNQCLTTYGWNDDGSIGCARSCSESSLAQQIATAYMRTAGTAWMSWLVDEVTRAPESTATSATTYDVSQHPAVTLQEMRAMLHPIYMFQVLPVLDPWGMPYDYRLAENLLQSEVMVIRSSGADGRFQYPLYTVGQIDVGSDDLVWADGYFVRWHVGGDGSLLFGDNFETRDVAAWSLTTPEE